MPIGNDLLFCQFMNMNIIYGAKNLQVLSKCHAENAHPKCLNHASEKPGKQFYQPHPHPSSSDTYDTGETYLYPLSPDTWGSHIPSIMSFVFYFFIQPWKRPNLNNIEYKENCLKLCDTVHGFSEATLNSNVSCEMNLRWTYWRFQCLLV